MKKLLLLYISIIGFILPMWADFDPTKDTPPEVLPENIHPVQGKELNDKGKSLNQCHTFLDDIVGAIAAAAATRVSQIISEETARKE